MRNGIPTSLTFEGNISERDFGALMVGGVGYLKTWPAMFVFTEKQRPDDVRVEVTLKALGLTKRQERLFEETLKGTQRPEFVSPGSERGDV